MCDISASFVSDCSCFMMKTAAPMILLLLIDKPPDTQMWCIYIYEIPYMYMFKPHKVYYIYYILQTWMFIMQVIYFGIYVTHIIIYTYDTLLLPAYQWYFIYVIHLYLYISLYLYIYELNTLMYTYMCSCSIQYHIKFIYMYIYNFYDGFFTCHTFKYFHIWITYIMLKCMAAAFTNKKVNI